MKLTLIKPSIGRMMKKEYIDEGRMQPLQLGLLAAMTPKNIEVAMYDDRMEEIPYDKPTDLVGITVETFTAKRAYEISQEFRNRKIKVIMGGMHPTLIPEECTEHADTIVIGDAETVWQKILWDFKTGELQRVYRGKPSEPQPNILTNRKIFKKKRYLPLSLVQFGRGCIYDCKYCAISVFFNKSHYCRKVTEVVKEINEQKLKFIFFVDDNIIVNKENAKELFKSLIPLKIKWVSQASLDMLKDSELMELMVKSGCIGNVIGFESIDLNNLHEMGKEINITNNFNRYEKQIQMLRDYRLMTWAAFTVGHEYDTVDSIKELAEFAISNKFTFAAFNILMPFPNTPLYEKLKVENRLLYNGKWWLHPDYRFNYASFIPKRMSPDELTEAASYARKKFNSKISIIKRAFDLKTNMNSLNRFILYLSYNLLFHKEVFKKQALIFGKESNQK